MGLQQAEPLTTGRSDILVATIPRQRWRCHNVTVSLRTACARPPAVLPLGWRDAHPGSSAADLEAHPAGVVGLNGQLLRRLEVVADLDLVLRQRRNRVSIATSGP